MLTDFVSELSVFIDHSKRNLVPWLAFIGGLWIFNMFNWLIGSRLNILGIYPRHAFGLIGIPFCPFLHQNFNHLFFNTVPLFVLGLTLLARGLIIFYWATLGIIGLGGLMVWLLGRQSLHIGASGLVSGYFGFILITAYLQPSFTTVILAGLVVYYFGGILLGIFPKEDKISWESHLFGFLSGIISAYLPQLGFADFFRQLSAFVA